MSPDEANGQPVPVVVGKVFYADASVVARIGPGLSALSDPVAAGWEKVKANASRTVYRGRIGEQEVYVKHYHQRWWGHRVLRKLGRCDARREMQFSLYLREQGIPTPRPLAYAAGEPSWFATAALTDSQGGDAWHIAALAAGPAGQGALRQASAQLARLIGKMHACGVIHRDLHCGNVLVRCQGGRVELAIMDLHRMCRRRRLSRRAMSANLAVLLHDRIDFTTRTERVRFLRDYLQASGAPGSLRGWLRMVEQHAGAHTRRRYANRDRRIDGDGKYFTRLRLPGGWRGRAVLSCKHVLAGSRAAAMEFTSAQWHKALEHPEQLLGDPANEVVKDSASGRVLRRHLRVGGHDLEVYVKAPRRKHAWKLPLDCLRPSRPKRAFALGHQLLNRRIATALPLAYLERRVGPVLMESVLITEAVNSPLLKSFLNTWLGVPPQGDVHLTVPQQRHLAQQVLAEMGRMLQRLHDKGYSHRDLKAGNLLVRWEGPSPELVLLDLDGLKRTWHITQRRRYQGLMRLNVSLLECPVVNHEGRLRMLLGYLRRPGVGRINFKPYWRTLEVWSARKLRKQIRSRQRRQKGTRRPKA
jgi:tRNA A-37 threonylcarbamoyl transferase component Bud32